MKTLVVSGLFLLCLNLNHLPQTTALPAGATKGFTGLKNPAEAIYESANAYKDITPESVVPASDHAKPVQVVAEQTVVPLVEEEAAIIPETDSLPAATIPADVSEDLVVPVQQVAEVYQPESSAAAVSTVQNVVAEPAAEIPVANNNPFSTSFFEPGSHFVPYSEVFPKPIPRAEEYENDINTLAPGPFSFTNAHESIPSEIASQQLPSDSIFQHPAVISPISAGFPGSHYVQSYTTSYEPRTIHSFRTLTAGQSNSIFLYNTYESEFEVLTKGEGSFFENTTLLEISTTIVKKMGQAQRAVTPILQELIEDPSGESTIQICSYSKGRLTLTRAVKDFMAELSHMVAVDANLGHSDCRPKAYRAFRVLQDVIKEVRRNFKESEVIKETDPLYFIDEIEDLIQEGIRQITSKTK